MISAILRLHGVRAGAYLSPHLVSFTERIRVQDSDLEPGAFQLQLIIRRQAAAAPTLLNVGMGDGGDGGLAAGHFVADTDLANRGPWQLAVRGTGAPSPLSTTFHFRLSAPARSK